MVLGGNPQAIHADLGLPDGPHGALALDDARAEARCPALHEEPLDLSVFVIARPGADRVEPCERPEPAPALFVGAELGDRPQAETRGDGQERTQLRPPSFQWLRNCGTRFSRKADSASSMSRVWTASTWLRFSSAIAASSEGASTFVCRISLVRRMPNGLLAAISRARSTAEP